MYTRVKYIWPEWKWYRKIPWKLGVVYPKYWEEFNFTEKNIKNYVDTQPDRFEIIYENNKSRFERNWWLWTWISIIATIILAIISRILSSGEKEVTNNNMSSENWFVIASNNWFIEQNIIQKSPLEIENEKHRSDNKAKISWFFKYRNAQEYLKWINNIDLEIQRPFTERNMQIFRDSMTKYFEVISDEPRGEISNSDFYVYTKHNVELLYWYQWKEYVDKLLIVVWRKKEDLKQHHITQIQCEWTTWPFCDFLKK